MLAAVIVSVALFLTYTVEAQAERLYVMVSANKDVAFGSRALCDSFERELIVATQTATQRTDTGGLHVPCDKATFVNQSFTIAQVNFERSSTRNAVAYLARARGPNAVRKAGVVAATMQLNLEDRTKDEGLEAYAVVLASVLCFAVSALASTLCLRRAALRKARSVKFKDVVRFEIELAGEYEPHDAADEQTSGVPLPRAHNYRQEL